MYFRVRYKFSTNKFSAWKRVVSTKRSYFHLLKSKLFFWYSWIHKKKKGKENFPDNYSQNIPIPFHILLWFLITNSEMEVNNYHEKLNVPVASQVTLRLKDLDLRKVENFRKTSNIAAHMTYFSVVLPIIRTWQ